MRFASLTLVVALAGASAGCGFLEFLRSLGFSVHTTISVREAGRTRIVDLPRVILDGFWQRDFAGARGSTTRCDVETNDNGRAVCGGGRAPAIWEFFNFGSRDGFFNPCTGQRVTIFTAPLGTSDIFCPTGIGIFFTAAPDSIDVQSPPATFMVYGQGISAAYGMPVIEFWDETGTVVMQTTATEVAPDGTWARGTTPYIDASRVYGGAYTVGVNNALAGGGYDTVGYASLSVTNSNPPPLPEPEPEPTPTPCNQDPDGPQMECQPLYY
jgi:hypothetical protein